LHILFPRLLSSNGATKSATINQGTPKSFTYTALYHRDGSAAVNSYLSGPTQYSFITKVPLKGIDNKTINTINTITPLQPIGMGAVY